MTPGREATALALVACLVSLTSCTGLRYVTQAAAGQDDLNRRARDIDQLVGEERVDARMRRLLAQVAPMKRFGERHGLTATTNYTKYVRIDRPAVVWVVSASDPLRFRSKAWSFPIVGSFTYLGWFKLEEANAFAGEQRALGLDVDVRGAGAYSTAGFFDDSVLSTMIPAGKAALGGLANTILHESAHATFFVKHQSTLNESVANFIGDKLAERYLSETTGPDSEEAAAYFASERNAEKRGRVMRAAYVALEELFASAKPDAQKLAEKSAIVGRLRADLRITRPVNNATLIQYKTYNSGQEELAALLHACGDDWLKFVRALKRLESVTLSPPQETDVGKLVTPLIDARCAGGEVAGGGKAITAGEAR